VFQNITIHKQFIEYNELKESLNRQLALITRWSAFLNLVGVTYLIYLTVSLFVAPLTSPLACTLAQLMVYGTDFGNFEAAEGWIIIIYKILGFMNAMCFIVLGTYIAYYKSVIKVDTMKQIKSMCLICVIVFTIAGLAHLGAVVYCAFFEDKSTDPTIQDSTKHLI